MTFTVLLAALFGIFLSLVLDEDMTGRIFNNEHTSLFGWFPWTGVGILGYSLIATTVAYPVVTEILVGIAGLVTVWLMLKARRIRRLGCPVCPVIWALNFVLVGLMFYDQW